MGESVLDLLIKNKGGLQWLVDELGGGDGQVEASSMPSSMPRLSDLSDEVRV